VIFYSAKVSNTKGLLLMLVFSLDPILSLGGPRSNPWLLANCRGRISKYCHDSLKYFVDPIIASKTECQLHGYQTCELTQ